MRNLETIHARSVILGATIVMVGILTAPDAWVFSRQETNDDAAIRAVYEYVRFMDPNLSESQRREVVQGRVVRELKDWPFQERLREHRLFVFTKGSSPSQGAIVVAVGDSLIPFRIEEMRDINELLQREGVLIGNVKEAREVADLFLKCYRASYVLDSGYELGVNVISRPDDIPFRDDAERALVTRELRIDRPKVVQVGENYHYTFYSWGKEGGGLVEKHEIVMDRKGMVDYKTVRLRGGVGLWVGVR